MRIDDSPHHFLLVAGHGQVAQAVRRALADTYDHAFVLAHVETVAEGLDRLHTQSVRALLLDLVVADGQGRVTFESVQVAAPHVPILVLCATADEDSAQQAVERGAWEYVLTDDLQAHSLTKALHRMVLRTEAATAAACVEQGRAQVTLNSIGDAVLCTDTAGSITFLNTVAEELTGWSYGEAAGRPFGDVLCIVDGLTRLPAQNPMELAVALNKIVGLTANCVLTRRDGTELAIEDSVAPIRDRSGQVTGAVMVFRDVSAARAAALAVSHRAQHDVLTGLPNRTLLNDRLSRAIAVAGRHRTRFAVLFLDVDRFKEMNDSLGHAIGDQLLQSIAQRLLNCVRSSDTVSRRGGDEFVILLSDIAKADTAVVVNTIIAAISTPHRIGGLELQVTATIGVSIYPEHGEDAETLITNADDAMYSAKGTNANRYQFFDSSMNVRAVEWRSIQAGLQGALARLEFELHYQPKVQLDTGAIVGAEALIRWHHPDRGLVPPTEFVPVAEACGLVVPIGQWVVREACRQARAWQDAGLPPTPVAVNISALEFRNVGFLGHVQTVLADSGLKPRYLELELTESVLMQYADSTVGILQALKEMGVQVAIDDFGIGYSSLSYLQQFPISVLKIDRSFVREITSDLDSAPIVAAVIGLGKALKHRVIAEGVETRAQLTFLRAHRCPEGQGRLFSPALTAKEFATVLRTGLSNALIH